jgi:hypothetical protein
LESELPEVSELMLGGEWLSDEGVDESGDAEPLLFDSEDPDESLLLLLEECGDDFELGNEDLLSDESDELNRELLGCELCAEDPDVLSLEPRDREPPLDSELRRLLLGLLFDELIIDLEPLLSDDSLGELGEERDDSLTLENDLLDP